MGSIQRKPRSASVFQRSLGALASFANVSARRAIIGLTLACVGLLAAPAVGALALTLIGGGLSISMSEAASVNSGGNLTYTIYLGNAPTGSTLVCYYGKPWICHEVPTGSVASGLMVTDPLPSGVSFQSVTANSGFSCGVSGQVVTCSNGSIPVNGSASITITTTVSAPCGGNPTITNTATVSPKGLSASGQTNVAGPPLNPPLSVSAALSPGNSQATPLTMGNTLTYAFTVTNCGSSTLTNLQASGSNLVMNGSGLGSAANPGSSASATNGWTCQILANFSGQPGVSCNGSLAPSASTTITVVETTPTGTYIPFGTPESLNVWSGSTELAGWQQTIFYS